MNIIEMHHITKRFPGTLALDGVDFELRQDTILSLLGENGAGKTTLMKVLYGMIQPDEGEIFYNGERLELKSPNDAIEKGICMVHQHFMLVPAFTVTQNIIVGNEPGKNHFLDMKTAQKEVRELIEQFHFNIDPDIRVEKLSVGEQQRVEILKAVYRKAKVLILDEPTAVLTPLEVVDLFTILNRLREQGVSIVIITHKLKETMAIADSVSVLRDGRLIDRNVNPKTCTMEELSKMMVGRDVQLGVMRRSETIGKVRFQVKNLNVVENGRRVVEQVSFDIHENEILGIAGIEGNGQTQLLEALTGLREPESMEIYMDDRKVHGFSDVFLKNGIGHVPEDRGSMGLVGTMSIANNLILGYHRENAVSEHGFLKKRVINRYANECKDNFQIKCPDVNTPVNSLSGGNQQKVVIARTFSHNPDVLIIAQPTRGVDVGAMEYIHHKLLDIRDEGKAVLLVSADLDEVRSLSDRLLVMYEGKLVAECSPDEYTDTELGLLMTGSHPRQRNERRRANETNTVESSDRFGSSLL